MKATKFDTKKLLAAVAVFAMVVSAVALVETDNDVAADPATITPTAYVLEGTVASVNSEAGLIAAINDLNGTVAITEIKLTAPISGVAAAFPTITKAVTINLNSQKITTSADAMFAATESITISNGTLETSAAAGAKLVKIDDDSKTVTLSSVTLNLVNGGVHDNAIAGAGKTIVTGTYDGTTLYDVANITLKDLTVAADIAPAVCNVEGTVTLSGITSLPVPSVITSVNKATVNFDNVTLNGNETLTVSGEVTVSGKVIANGNVNLKFDDKVTFKGDVTNGDNTIQLKNVSSDGVTITTASTGILIDKDFSGNGSVTVAKGKVALGGDVAFGDNVKVKIVKGATLDVAGNTVKFNEKASVTVNGTLDASAGTVNNAGKITVIGTFKAGTLVNSGTIAVTDKNAKFEVTPANVTNTGTIDISGIQKNVYIGGEINTTETPFTSNQVVIADKDTVFVGGELTFFGKFVINEGVTVTIKNGSITLKEYLAMIENNGTIVVECANGIVTEAQSKIVNNGTITTQAEAAPAGACIAVEGTLVNNGTMTVGVNTAVKFADNALVNNKDLTVNGKLNVETSFPENNVIVNNGTINFNGTEKVFVVNKGTVNVNGAYTGTVSLADVDAIVSVKSLAAGNTVTINNDGLEFADKSKVGAGKNVVSIAAGANSKVGAMDFKTDVVATKSGTSTVYSSMIIVSGELAATKAAETATSFSGTFKVVAGDVVVNDKLKVAGNITFDVDAGKLTVNGEMNFAKGATVTDTGKVIVKGTVTIVTAYTTTTCPLDNYEAAYYVVKDDKAATADYTPFDTQHIFTTLENAMAAGAKKVTVTAENYTIEKDMAIPAETTVEFVLGTTGVLTVAKNATVTVDKAGVLKATDKKVDVKGTIVAGIKSADASAGTFETGIDADPIVSDVVNAGADTITYTNLMNALNIAKPGEKVVLTIDEALVSENITIKDGVTLLLKDSHKVVFDNEVTVTIDGTIELDGGAVEVKDSADGKEIAKYVLNGKFMSNNILTAGKNLPAGAFYSISNEMGDTVYYIEPVENAVVNITTYDECKVTVNGINNLGDLKVVGKEGMPAVIVFTEKLKAGTITLDNAEAKISKEFVGTFANANGSVVLSTSNSSFTVASADADLTVSGTPAVAKMADLKVVGNVAFDGVTVAFATVDGKLTIKSDSTITDLLVNGEVAVAENERLTVSNDATVFGTLGAVAEGSKVAVGNDLFIGIDKADLKYTGAAAAVNGNVEIAADSIAFALAGATVASESITSLGKVEYKIDGAVWVTAYAKDTVAIPELKPVVKDAIYNTWNGLSGNFPAAGETKVLTINVTKDIYTVTVFADEGIGTVAIDGVILAYENGNKFTLAGYKLEAGTHTVSFQFKNGYEGTVKMTVNGKAADGLKFVASGVPAAGAAEPVVKYTLNLQGAAPIVPEVPEPQPQPEVKEDDGLTITDYLLIVLVVLIAIMAVMVAMKLMRS